MNHFWYILQDPTSVNSEGLSKAELGRLVASRWTGENVDDVGKSYKKGHDDELDVPEPAEAALEDEHDIPEPAEESYAGYHSDVEDDRHKYDDEELSNASDDEYPDNHEEPDETYKSDDDQKSDYHSGIMFV
jgi:protein kinase C substrate 80K-H